jgi:hypothetical protein
MENKNNKIKRKEWLENAVYALEDFLKEKDPSLELKIFDSEWQFSILYRNDDDPKWDEIHETPYEDGVLYISTDEIDTYTILEIPPDEFFVFNWDKFPFIRRRRFFENLLMDLAFFPHLPLLKAAKGY